MKLLTFIITFSDMTFHEFQALIELVEILNIGFVFDENLTEFSWGTVDFKCLYLNRLTFSNDFISERTRNHS